MKYDENIVQKAMTGDKEAFAALYSEVYRDMYRYAYAMLGNATDAEDVVSDAVIDIYKYIRTLRDAKSFGAWATKILWSKCKMKRKEYVDKTEELSEEIRDESHNPSESVTYIGVCQALEKLDKDERNVVVLGSVYGYNSSEIGTMLGIKATTVRSKLARGLEKIRRISI